MKPDVIVIGGGLVGSAIAYGLSKTARVLILDEGDRVTRVISWNGAGRVRIVERAS